MLLVQPVQEVIKFLPVLLGLVVFGTATGGVWALIGIAVPVALGVARYLTTSFRITEDRVELRRGVLERRLLSTPLDRVRTVDLTASPIHRVLGLSTVRIGTGTASTDSDERIDIDGIATARAEELRAQLLEVAPAGPPGETPVEQPELVVARFTPRWLGYAPFTSGGLAIAGAMIAIGTQIAPDIEIDTAPAAPGVLEWWWVLALLAVLLVAVLTVVAYAAAYWGMTVTRATPDAPWRIRRGLFTTRETSIDPERLSGVTLRDPLPMRIARGARLQAIVTGIRSGGSEAAPGSTLVPPAPRSVALAAAGTVLGDPDAVRRPLVDHGRRATTRRYTRALLPATVLAAVAVAAAAATGIWWLAGAAPVLLLGAAGLAWDRARSLGHRSSDGLLVARSGSLTRRHDLLADEYVIGWTFRATWFQRRAGLTDATATIAGGDQRIRVIDVPQGTGLAVARAATPGLLEEFLGTGPASSGAPSPESPQP